MLAALCETAAVTVVPRPSHLSLCQTGSGESEDGDEEVKGETGTTGRREQENREGLHDRREGAVETRGREGRQPPPLRFHWSTAPREERVYSEGRVCNPASKNKRSKTLLEYRLGLNTDIV